MQATYVSITSGAELVLGDFNANADIINLDDGEHARMTQEEPLFEAGAEVTFARGNLRNTMTLRVEKKHADAAAAFIYFSDHPDAVPGQGVLQVTYSGTDRFLDDATLKGIKKKLYGVSTVMEYTFTGGVISSS